VCILALLVTFRQSLAEPVAVTGDAFPYSPASDVVIDGGFAVGFPTALATGLSRGVAVGAMRGRTVALGVRAGWLTATESSLAWTVTHSDLRLRAAAAVQHTAGRGTFGVRLGAGGTLVHESRLRNQGERAGLMGEDLATSAYAMVPAADLEATIGLRLVGDWQLALAGGPSLALVDGSAHASWIAQLGIGWQR